MLLQGDLTSIYNNRSVEHDRLPSKGTEPKGITFLESRAGCNAGQEPYVYESRRWQRKSFA
jgi:hypothetical protein